jgi:hypothetical protein
MTIHNSRPECDMTRSQQLQLAYTEAIAQLRLHPELIWTRSNFFLLVNSGLFAFATSDAADAWQGSPLLIPLAGIFISLIWIWVNLAGQRLQREWRRLVLQIEKELFQAEEGQAGVAGPFTRAAATAREGASWKVSITSALVILSLGFLGGWGYLLGRAIHTTSCAG